MKLIKLWLQPSEFEEIYLIKEAQQAKLRMKYKKVNGVKVKQDFLPHSKVGKFIFYNKNDVDIWIKKQQVTGA